MSHSEHYFGTSEGRGENTGASGIHSAHLPAGPRTRRLNFWGNGGEAEPGKLRGPNSVWEVATPGRQD
jgi:hypothetical protein